MKIYCDFEIQYNRITDLLKCTFENNILNDITFTNKIAECDLILLLLNSSKSLININKLTKKKIKIKTDDKNYMIRSTSNDEIERHMYFKYNKPIIILERLDSSVSWVRYLDKYPNVIAVFKNRIVKDNEINNLKLYYGRYHAKIITESLKKNDILPINRKNKKDLGTIYFKKFNKLDEISELNFHKYKCVLWDFWSSPISEKMIFFKKYKFTDGFKKEIDVFCVHTIRPGVIGKHREKAINIVENIENITYRTKKCSENIYNNDFIKSKICIACWGFGEWTHMDGYAMYSKTILIKPNSDYVYMEPDIYNPKRYIPCKADFSDLKDIICDILKNYDKYNQMIENNYNFIKNINKIDYTKKFWNNIKTVFDENK